MSDRVLKVRQECEALLEERRGWMDAALKQDGREDEPQAAMFMRALDFGLQSMRAADLLLEQGDTYALQVCCIARAFFESAVQMLWASRCKVGSQDHWARLQVSFAQEDLKWAENAEKHASMAAHAATIRKDRQEVVDRVDEHGQKIKPAPNLHDMLIGIYAADRVQGLGAHSQIDEGYIYTNIYRLLCQPVHGHPGALGAAVGFHRIARVGLMVASVYLLEAICHIGSSDPKQEISDLAGRIADLMKLED